MLKPNEVEEIKKLIKYGFDLDLISFEFDIKIIVIKIYAINCIKIGICFLLALVSRSSLSATSDIIYTPILKATPPTTINGITIARAIIALIILFFIIYTSISSISFCIFYDSFIKFICIKIWKICLWKIEFGI